MLKTWTNWTFSELSEQKINNNNKSQSCFATFIPCHWGQHKVQATVWCRSSLWSKCPPVPRGTPAPVWSTTSLAHMVHEQRFFRKKGTYLHLILSEESIQDEISPEHRPLTFNILKQLELCWVVVQSRWVLMRQKSKNRTKYEEAVASKENGIV